MATSKKVLHEALRKKYIGLVSDYLATQEEQVLTTNSNEIAIPVTDSEGNEEFLVITFKVPTGSREDGIVEPYDGFAVAEDFQLKQAEKAEKAEKAKIAKDKKILRDTALREKKAKEKAEKEKKEG